MTFHDDIPSNLLYIPTLPLLEEFDQSRSSIHPANPIPQRPPTGSDIHAAKLQHHCLYLTIIDLAPQLHLQCRPNQQNSIVPIEILTTVQALATSKSKCPINPSDQIPNTKFGIPNAIPNAKFTIISIVTNRMPNTKLRYSIAQNLIKSKSKPSPNHRIPNRSDTHLLNKNKVDAWFLWADMSYAPPFGMRHSSLLTLILPSPASSVGQPADFRHCREFDIVFGTVLYSPTALPVSHWLLADTCPSKHYMYE